MPRSYSSEFRRKVLDLLEAGRAVSQVASDLQISEQSIYLWRKRERRSAAIQVMAAETLPVQTTCEVLGVSDAGYYAWLKRGPSARAVRHAWLTDVIAGIHVATRGVYGSRRAHAELRLGRGIVVSRGAVELLMNRAGIKRLPGPVLHLPAHWPWAT